VNAAEPGHNNAAVKPTEKRVRKSYERKASESDYHQDTEYLKFRNKKLEHLDKQGKHLLMYSNVN